MHPDVRALTKTAAALLHLAVCLCLVALGRPTPSAAAEPGPAPDPETVVRWAAPYRGWHYRADHVIPAEPHISGYEAFHNPDCPCVYQLPEQPDRWFMSFIGFDGHGYNSFVAQSTNLVDWTQPRLALGFGPL